MAAAGGVFAATPGLFEKYGPTRVFDTPISELALAGAAFGSAVSGLRPVVEIMFGDFLGLVMDSLVNQMSKYWFLTQGEVSVPVVIRSVVGGGGRFGAIHSQMPVSWFTGIPGVKIVAPSTPADAKSLLRSAIEDDNPVLFFEHKRLYTLEGEVDGRRVPLGEAAVVRAGGDVTIVSAMRGVHESLAAAETLAASGIDAEVVDVRTIRPLDAVDDPGLAGEDEPPRRGRGRPPDRRLGGRGPGARHRGGAGRPGRRLAHRHARLADPLQPAARGRPHPGSGAHRIRDRGETGVAMTLPRNYATGIAEPAYSPSSSDPSPPTSGPGSARSASRWG